MPTFLFNEIIFGPIRSRRLGTSLGVNLLPKDFKFCTYDCIYCECGWTLKSNQTKAKLPSREDVRMHLESKLSKMSEAHETLDSITFAGNGEPTTHPQFVEIINDTILLRNTFFKNAKISVLSNATQLHKPKIVEALKQIDQNILKLDAANDDLLNKINKPLKPTTCREIVENLKKFDGNLIIQTMFLRGKYDGIEVDNCTEEHVDQWIELLVEIKPKNVMIYPIERDTPAEGLEKIDKQELLRIAEKARNAGITVQVSV